MTTKIATLPRITPSALSSIILAQSSNLDPSLAIIDVRDDDHIGGHILGSTHVPSSTLDHKMPELVRKLQNKDTVVFHCALSQMRGPGAAVRYLRERERLLGATPQTGGSKTNKKGSQSANGRFEVGKEEEKEEEEKEEEEERVNEEGNQNGVKDQKVYVLDRGFVGWQEMFGEDERLTEKYSRELWKDGYWM